MMVKSVMQRFWQRAPRRLRTTRAGRLLVLIALAAGLAALNTGNNLLFFGWGMVLSAIVVSGVLSEATLRYLSCVSVGRSPLRAQHPGYIAATLHNGSGRMPAFGLDAQANIAGPYGPQSCRAPYALRLAPKAQLLLHAPFTPQARGPYDVVEWEVTTAYPFGFFEKSRRLPIGRTRLWAAPQKVPVKALVDKLVAHWGEQPSGRQGSGEDFFALRPHRQGDDWRRINWRRSARTGRLVLVEHEAVAGRQIVLELRLNPAAKAPQQEQAISILGSLAEALVAAGLGVGIYTHGVALVPERGLRHAQVILAALARLEIGAPVPRPPAWHGVCASICLVGPGALAAAAASRSVPLRMDTVAA